MSQLSLLEKRIKWTAIQDAGIAVVVLVLAFVAIAAGITLARTEINAKAVVVGGMGLLFLWVAWILAQSARALWSPRESTLYAELSGDGAGIGWAHLTTGALSAIKVYFLDGSMCTIYARRSDGEALLSLVQSRAAHAVIGFGPEQEAAYVALVKGMSAR